MVGGGIQKGDARIEYARCLKMVERLCRETSGWAPDELPVQMIQTHISVVLLGRRHVLLLIRRSLEHVPVSQIMWSRFVTVALSLSLNTFIEECFIGSDQHAFPENGRLVGLVCFEDVRRVDPSTRATLTVGAIISPAHDLATATLEEASAEALEVLSRRDVNHPW